MSAQQQPILTNEQPKSIARDPGPDRDTPQGGWWAKFLAVGLVLAFVMIFVPESWRRVVGIAAAACCGCSVVALIAGGRRSGG